MLRERLIGSRSSGDRKRREPEPPFQKLATDVLWVGFKVDAAQVAPFIPEGLVLSDASIGVLGIYQAETGFGLAPYQRALVGVSVEGVPGSDAGEGMLLLGNIMDEPGAGRVKRLYSRETVIGTARTWRADGLLHGVAEVDGVEWVRATVRPKGPLRRDLSGVDTFFGMTEAGLIKHADANVSDMADAEVVSVEIADAAGAAFRALRPSEFVFALHAEQVNSIWSEPRVVGRAAGDAGALFLGLIEDAGRAAAIVRHDGTLLDANPSGRALLGDGGAHPGETLLSAVPAEKDALYEALKLSIARRGPRVSAPIALTQPGGQHLLAYVMPLEHGKHGGEAALVLLADPRGPERRDAAQMLQLFGLTAAEARLGALIGIGRGAREAAAELQISEHTARSTLKTVYDKLGIRKQSELGHLVARLQHF
ncbi:MAG: helix-turn-helix transcriptional regulator [Devosia sp.]